MNEGLEVLGGSEDDQRCGVFGETGIRQVTLPSTLRVLGARAFSGCGELRCVAFAEGVAIAEIGAGCFSDSGVEQVTVPASVTTIRDEVFSGCVALKKVSFQEGSKLKRIGRKCFFKTDITEIKISKTVEMIGANAFTRCENLKVIHVEDGCECSFSTVRIPDSVKVVFPQENMTANGYLWERGTLKEVIIPKET